MNFKSIFYAFILIVFVSIVFSCKSKKQTSQKNLVAILLLLKEPADIKAISATFKEWEIYDFKRTSRSQNLWSFNCNCTKVEAQELIAQMNKEESVVNAKFPPKIGKATNSKSSKKVKTAPIRNK